MNMKRLLLLAAIGAFASSNNLLANTYHPRKVGIGTNKPTERLTLSGGNFALQTADNLEDQSILFQNAELEYTWRVYRADVDGLLADLRIAGGLSLDSSTLPDILTISNTGRVGIGTTAPASKLSVEGDIEVSGSRLHVGSNGKVGIGTAEPAAELHVEGDIIASGSVTIEDGLAVMVPKGSIIMWSGIMDPDGHPMVDGVADTRWHICDGAAGTPDLRDRFVVGAGGTHATGDTGGSAEVTLTADQLPSHGHSFSGTTSTNGDHKHWYDDAFWDTEQSVTPGAWNAANNDYYLWEGWTDSAGNHSHTFSGTTTSVGGGGTHENRPPYYALTFIMHVGD